MIVMVMVHMFVFVESRSESARHWHIRRRSLLQPAHDLSHRPPLLRRPVEVLQIVLVVQVIEFRWELRRRGCLEFSAVGSCCRGGRRGAAVALAELIVEYLLVFQAATTTAAGIIVVGA